MKANGMYKATIKVHSSRLRSTTHATPILDTNIQHLEIQ